MRVSDYMNACKRCVHWSPGSGKSGHCETLAESELVFPYIAFDVQGHSATQKADAFETDGEFYCPLFEEWISPVTRQLVKIADGPSTLEETG